MVSSIQRFLSPMIRRTPALTILFHAFRSTNNFTASILADTDCNQDGNILDLTTPATFQINTIHINIGIIPGKRTEFISSCREQTEKKEKQDQSEIKIGIAYDGWRKTGQDRYALENKVVVAGFSKAKEFQEYREAVIAQEFDLNEVSQRILNADGASWIKKVKDKSTCFQLDPFHRNKAVKEKIHEETARDAILGFLREEEIEELFRYLEIYRNSLSDEDEIEDAEELIRYYENNREGLLPYQSQDLELPNPPEGLEYRNMGTMENHVWSVIAKRMKHGHRSWSRRGGNHLAKILAKKCSGKLYEVTERLRKPVFEEEKVEELYGEILMLQIASLNGHLCHIWRPACDLNGGQPRTH